MDKIKTVKIKNEDGTVSEESYSISVDATNVDMSNGKDLQDTVGDINIDRDGNIATQLNNKINNSDIIDNLNSEQSNKPLSAKQGYELNIRLNKKPYYFDTVADMKADVNLKKGDYAKTLGFYEKNDGGSALYKIRNITNEDVVNNATIIVLSNNTLVAELIKSENVNPKIYGAKLDGLTDDTSIFALILQDCNILMPASSNVKLNNLSIPNTKKIDFNNSNVYSDSDKFAIKIGATTENFYHRDIEVNNAQFMSNGISLIHTIFSKFYNCNLSIIGENQSLFELTNCFNITIENCNCGRGNVSRANGSYGIKYSSVNSSKTGTNNITNVSIKNCLLQNVEYGINLNCTTGSYDSISIENCGFSNDNYGILINGNSASYNSMKNIEINCSRVENSNYGIFAKAGLLISNCHMYNIATSGIYCDNGRFTMVGDLTFTGGTSGNISITNFGSCNMASCRYQASSNYSITNKNSSFVRPLNPVKRTVDSNDFSFLQNSIYDFVVVCTGTWNQSDLPTTDVFQNQNITIYQYNNTNKPMLTDSTKYDKFPLYPLTFNYFDSVWHIL